MDVLKHLHRRSQCDDPGRIVLDIARDERRSRRSRRPDHGSVLGIWKTLLYWPRLDDTGSCAYAGYYPPYASLRRATTLQDLFVLVQEILRSRPAPFTLQPAADQLGLYRLFLRSAWGPTTERRGPCNHDVGVEHELRRLRSGR